MARILTGRSGRWRGLGIYRAQILPMQAFTVTKFWPCKYDILDISGQSLNIQGYQSRLSKSPFQ